MKNYQEMRNLCHKRFYIENLNTQGTGFLYGELDLLQAHSKCIPLLMNWEKDGTKYNKKEKIASLLTVTVFTEIIYNQAVQIVADGDNEKIEFYNAQSHALLQSENNKNGYTLTELNTEKQNCQKWIECNSRWFVQDDLDYAKVEKKADELFDCLIQEWSNLNKVD